MPIWQSLLFLFLYLVLWAPVALLLVGTAWMYKSGIAGGHHMPPR